MKVLLLNGSPREKGCTYTALSEIAAALNGEGVCTEIFWAGKEPVQDCVACGGCAVRKSCVFDDAANVLIEKAKEADGFVFGAPVYFSHPTGSILSLLDRALHAYRPAFEHKPSAGIASARRAGSVASVDVLNKYFTIAQMPVVSSTYWNVVYGMTPEEVRQDLEGMRTMRNLGRNMAWLLKCVEAGRAQGILPPERERGGMTNFIR